MNAPSHCPKTGEHFIMRPRQMHAYDANVERRTSGEYAHLYWQKLRETILACGGEVDTVPPTRFRGLRDRSAMFVRDTGVMIYHEDTAMMVIPTQHSARMHGESRALKPAMEARGIVQMPLPGSMEGGNIVFDAHRNTLYWGVNNREHMRELERKGDQFHPAWRRSPEKKRIAEHIHKTDMIHSDAKALATASAVLDGHAKVEKNNAPFQVIPMFVPDRHSVEFYHLDGALGILPSGQMVVCREALSHVSQRAIAASGADIYPVSMEEARLGATNFITVGGHVITPYASPGLKQFFEKQGYAVIDPPSVGLPRGAWQFGPMAGVRCATLKTTRDMGFPAAPQPDAGRGRA